MDAFNELRNDERFRQSGGKWIVVGERLTSRCELLNNFFPEKSAEASDLTCQLSSITRLGWLPKNKIVEQLHQLTSCAQILSRCLATFTTNEKRPLGDMRIDLDRAVMVLSMLLEGMSISARTRLQRWQPEFQTRGGRSRSCYAKRLRCV